MKKILSIMLILGGLISGAIYLKSTEPVPPCDEYLVWCMYTWCPQHNQGYENIQKCHDECQAKYHEWCD